MKRATTSAVGLAALVVMLVLGVFSAGSASAHQFSWTGPLPALILVLNDNNQIFITEPGGFQVTCRHFKAHGIIPKGSTMTVGAVRITGTYSKCEATGGISVTVSPVEYEISAEGFVNVVGSPIVLTAGGVAKCSIKVSPGGGNNDLLKLLFLNQKEDLLVHVEVGGIHSIPSGLPCGTAGVESTEGTYTGLLLVQVDGGTIKWE